MRSGRWRWPGQWPSNNGVGCGELDCTGGCGVGGGLGGSGVLCYGDCGGGSEGLVGCCCGHGDGGGGVPLVVDCAIALVVVVSGVALAV